MIDWNIERVERDMLFSMAKDGDVLYDVGANEGLYSLDFASRFLKGTVYAFEPSSVPMMMLKSLAEQDGFTNIIPWSCGLADKVGPACFYHSSKDSGATCMRPLEEVRFGPSQITSEAVTTIDDVVALGNGIPSLIKCDVEGAELLVFKGAKHTLATHRPIVQCEMLRKWAARFGYHPNDLIKFFSNLHYRCYVIRDGKLEPFDVMTEGTVETNFFFLPEDHNDLNPRL